MLIETTEHIHRVKGAPLYYIGLTHQPKVATFYDYHSPSSPPYTNYDFLISMSKFVPQSSSLTLTPPISPLLVTEQTQEQSVKRGSVIMKVENCQVTVKDASVDQHICRWENCYRFFVSLEKLANHVSIAHSTVGSKNLYYCKWEGCQRSERGFNARYKMLVHCRTHTKEKPHFCTFKDCTKAFSRAENLKIHYRSHTLEKPYCCAFPGCIKAYSNSSDRFKHSRTHQNNKPYMCKVEGCSKRYTDPSSLRKHVKTFNHDLSNHIDKGSQDEPMECELSPPHDIINAIDPTENIYFDSLSYKKQSESVGLCWLTSSDLSDKPLDLRISHNSADR